MRQLLTFLKQRKIKFIDHDFLLLSVVKCNILYTLSVMLKKHLQLKHTTATLALCVIVHHV